MSLQEHLKGNRQIETVPITQPNIASVGHTYFGLGVQTNHRPANIFSNAIMSTSPVFYNTPDVVNVHGTLPTQQVTHGVGAIRASAAPKKGCK